MSCNICKNQIELERQELNLHLCFSCANRTVKKVKGDMNYQHKTAPTLMVMTPSEHANYRRYVPYGKNTGRGSGTHRMTTQLASLK